MAKSRECGKICSVLSFFAMMCCATLRRRLGGTLVTRHRQARYITAQDKSVTLRTTILSKAAVDPWGRTGTGIEGLLFRRRMMEPDQECTHTGPLCRLPGDSRACIFCTYCCRRVTMPHPTLDHANFTPRALFDEKRGRFQSSGVNQGLNNSLMGEGVDGVICHVSHPTPGPAREKK